jgi:hypothetical protein
MAKAKKTESAKKDVKKAPAAKAKPTAAVAEKKAAAPAAKAPAAKAPAKKAVAKKSAPPQTAGGGGTPLIDTDLLAQNAASMLRNRSVIEGAAQGTQAEGKESAAFKNLKDQLAKPKPTGLSGLFGPAGEQKKSGGGFNPNQQRGHNQTFGGMKTGVPRRTNG